MLAAILLLVAGCAKYNTFFNAKRAFDDAEHVREEALRKHEDPPKPKGQQKTDYETAIRKAQKILDDYPGHSLTDDALFLQAKAYHRLESYRMSIRKLDLLFANFPKTEYMEEALYLQGLNHLLIGSLVKSQEYLDRLAKLFPDSRYQAETRRVIGDNAFTMKDWETAYDSYQEYLAQEGDLRDPDRIGLKLADCCWELHRYQEAVPVLDRVIGETLSSELAFRAKLLKVRMLTRLGRYDEAAALIEEIRPEAEIYRSQGMLALAEAENLFAQGRADKATPLLENMPDEWKTAEVRARAADLLGYRFLEKGEWEEAKKQFQEAIKNKTVLEDPERTRRLNGNLNDYLAAEAALKDAKGAKVPRLKLLEANALLFGLGRPHRAADLYLEAAADTAADSSDAARALYGAWLAYRDHLDRPDSAAIAAAMLQERFPASPQAFETRRDRGGEDLLEYLLGLQRVKQQENYAALSPEERAALESAPEESGAAARSGPTGPVTRRRMVYFSRRENLVFPAPERIIPLSDRLHAAHQRDEETESAGDRPAATAETGQAAGTGGVTAPAGSAPVGGGAAAAADSTAVGGRDAAEAARIKAAQDAAKKQEDEQKKKENEKKKKKKRSESWDILR